MKGALLSGLANSFDREERVARLSKTHALPPLTTPSEMARLMAIGTLGQRLSAMIVPGIPSGLAKVMGVATMKYVSIM